jgi:hypothetical protein
MKQLNLLSNAVILFSALALGCLGTANDVRAAEAPPVPDFTQGGKKPDTHDWTLGPTGARGWMYAANGSSTKARQILVTAVTKGSPADGILSIGDVILGVGDKPFDDDARIQFARAITLAEQQQGGGNLRLVRWHAGETENVSLKIPVMGTYSDTAPYACQKSKKILEIGCQVIAKRGLNDVTIPNNLNALALLASGNKEYGPMLADYAKKVSNYQVDSMATWYYGYANIFLAEYFLATGDKSVLPGIKRIAMECVKGQSGVGTWGHGFALPSGNLGGYGSMNLPALPLTISMVLARQAGINEPDLDRAIAKSAGFLRWYVNKGAIPYGDHEPWPGHEDNGKCSIATILYDLLGDKVATTFFARMSMAGYDERERGHTGNFFNILWALPGVSRCGPVATGAYWKEQSWYYDLARGPDGSFAYQGSPDGEEEHYKYTNYDCTGGYMLTYALPLKSLYITGKKPCAVPALNPKEVADVIAAGRDYFAARNGVGYAGRTNDQLLAGLSSWSPIVRLRAAQGLARQAKAEVVPALQKLLAGPDRNGQYGACEALEALKGEAASAVPALQQTLKNEDLWLRIRAARALRTMGKPAMAALPDLLRLLAKPSPRQDPRGMEQRFLCDALFDSRGGMLARSLEGVDRDALYAAVRVGLRNEDGRARGSICTVYQNLSSEEIKPLLPAIHQAVVKAAPSGEMFADAIRIEGLKVLAKHRVKEGIEACVAYTREQNAWASERRTPGIMKILLTYGTRAKPAIPELTKIADYFEKGEKGFPRELSLQKAQCVRETIRAIEASTDSPELIRLK